MLTEVNVAIIEVVIYIGGGQLNVVMVVRYRLDLRSALTLALPSIFLRKKWTLNNGRYECIVFGSFKASGLHDHIRAALLLGRVIDFLAGLLLEEVLKSTILPIR